MIGTAPNFLSTKKFHTPLFPDIVKIETYFISLFEAKRTLLLIFLC